MTGTINFSSMAFDPGSIRDVAVADNAAIASGKVRQLFPLATDFGYRANEEPAATQTVLMFEATSAGTLKTFKAMLKTSGTTTAISFDLKVNGSSVLASTVDFTNSDTDAVAKAGTINTPAVAAGDYIELVMTRTTSTGAEGPHAQVYLDQLVS